MKKLNKQIVAKLNPIKGLLILVIVSSISGCKKFLEIPPPKTELETSSTFLNSSTANGAALGIYSKMINDRGFPYRISLFTGMASDELKNYSTLTDVATFYKNNLSSTNTYLYSEFWNQGYSSIYAANSLLEGVSSSSTLPAPLKNQLIGEAKFIRAFWYFYLVNLFADVPLITTTDYTINQFRSRTSVVEVYQQVVSDLKDAQNLLNTQFVSSDGLSSTTERVRPSKWAATALLARVYLYTNDFANAENEATKVIDQSSAFSIVADPANVFLKNSVETIWALQTLASGSYSTPEGSNYILTSTPATGNIRNTTVSPDLLNAFETNDTRKTKWIGTFNTYSFPYKYKIRSGTSLTEYSIVLRLAEQYLIRAEARANGAGAGLNGAILDLNKIRFRAGLPNYIGPGIKDSVLNSIYHESQIEFFGEYGHRWFNLRRTGKIDQVMSIVTPLKGGTWSPYKALFPIPQKELDSDPNLSQNPGY